MLLQILQPTAQGIQFPFKSVNPGLQRVHVVELPLVLQVAQFCPQLVLVVETQPVLSEFIVYPMGQELQITELFCL